MTLREGIDHYVYILSVTPFLPHPVFPRSRDKVKTLLQERTANHQQLCAPLGTSG